MARASTRLDGMTAPVEIGFSIQVRMNCISSSRRRLFFSIRAIEGDGIFARSRLTRGGPRRNIHGYRDQGRGSRWLSRLAAPASETIKKLFDSTEETGRFGLSILGR